MSDPPLSDFDYKNKMAWVWTTLKKNVNKFNLSFSLKFKVFEDVCKNIANDYVIEMDPESDRKWVKRMTTFEGAMNTDINFQNIMDDKAAEPDKPPSVDVLKIRWTCENILEDVSR